MAQPRRAASIAAMSILCMVIIAANARPAAAGSGSAIASVSAIGVICQERPQRSLHQPQALVGVMGQQQDPWGGWPSAWTPVSIKSPRKTLGESALVAELVRVAKGGRASWSAET